MSLALLTVAPGSVPLRAARPAGDGATAGGFGDALARAAQALGAAPTDPASTTAGPEAGADLTATDLVAAATDGGVDDRLPSSEGTDAIASAPGAMPVVPLPLVIATGTGAEAHDVVSTTPAGETAAPGAAGEASAAAATSEPPPLATTSVAVASETATRPSGAPRVDAAPAVGSAAEAATVPAARGVGATDPDAAIAASETPRAGSVLPLESDPAPSTPRPTTALEAGPRVTASLAPTVRDAGAAAPGTPSATTPDDGGSAPPAASRPSERVPATETSAGSSITAAAAPAASVPLLPPTPAEAAAPTATQRSIAAQVAPAIVHIAQRPAGTHQITLTLSPDAIGPVTVRARIGPGGDVRVDLSGATEAGRDALRAMVADLRRDLAAVMPHAHLSVGSALSADTGAGERGAPGGDGSLPDPSGRGRGARPDDIAPSESARRPTRPLPAPSHAVVGAGLDIVV